MASSPKIGGFSTSETTAPPQFVIAPSQYLSWPFIGAAKTSHQKSVAQPRYLFTMARYALYHGLLSSGIAPGDEVLIPAYICEAAVEAVRACGAVPVFFGVRPDCSVDMADLESRITRRTRALLVVHYFGFPQDLKPVCELAECRRLVLIEDCAHVLTGRADGRPLGSTGDFSVFSWRKFIPSFDGAELRFNAPGLLRPPILHREPLIFDLKALKYVLDMRGAEGRHGEEASFFRLPRKFLQLVRGMRLGTQNEVDTSGPKLETNSSEFDPNFADAAISRVAQYVLRHSDIEAIAASRGKHYRELSERLAQIPGVSPLFTSLPENNCPLYLPIFFEGLPGAHRTLRSLGIPATAWDGVRPSPVSDQSFPDAGFLYNNLVFLPVHQNLRERDLDLIFDAVRKVRGNSLRGTITAGCNSPQLVQPKDTVRNAGEDSAGTGLVKKKLLMVAFHFPPQMGSSGLLRALKNSRYLPDWGWSPTVLTAHPRSYDRLDESQLGDVPAQVKVMRAFALDTRKHLSLKGRYLRHSALPDRWVTWALGAIPAGALEIYRNKIDVILTTFPIASAVLIGYLLHRITGVPWVADFRDSMTEKDYPHDPHIRRAYCWLEKKAVRHASRLIFTAESTREMYLARYPELSPERCIVIANGYDEKDFTGLAAPGPRRDFRLRIQHSGLIYPHERNPIPFFKALSRLKADGRIEAPSLSVELRACGNEEPFKEAVRELGIQDMVHFLPALPYGQALQDCSESDALLLLQGASCDHQIPAKAYEYLRLGKPILALASSTGDTAKLLGECGGATIIDIDDEDAICRTLPDFLKAVRAGEHPLPGIDKVSKYSRRNQARQLAECLSSVIQK